MGDDGPPKKPNDDGPPKKPKGDDVKDVVDNKQPTIRKHVRQRSRGVTIDDIGDTLQEDSEAVARYRATLMELDVPTTATTEEELKEIADDATAVKDKDIKKTIAEQREQLKEAEAAAKQ